MNRIIWVGILLFIFGLSRVYVWYHPPVYVRYFEEYANIWYYGLSPYLQHWYEYPPATIPFVMAPLLLDLNNIGSYQVNFRAMILLVDTILFLLILKVLQKLEVKPVTKFVSAGFYILLTLKAKDFLFENLDPLFSLSLFLPAVAPLIFPKLKSWFQWLFYWFGIGMKLVNAPLGLIYLLDKAKSFKSKISIAVIAGLLIWSIPLLMYRSSLLVITEFHKNRLLQVESIPALIVRGINIGTQSETIFFAETNKSYDIKGPISSVMLPLSVVSLGILMVVFLLWTVRNRQEMANPYMVMKATLIFTFTYLIANRVFSTPYHLWYLPLVTIYPYRNWRERLIFFVLSALFLGIGTTPIPRVQVGPTDLPTLLPVVFQIPAALLLLVLSYRLKVPEITAPSK